MRSVFGWCVELTNEINVVVIYQFKLQNSILKIHSRLKITMQIIESQNNYETTSKGSRNGFQINN